MRNLKRALSMAMASVMLMGMSVVGTSAASVSDFSDVDSINNLEAVSIATGLGIFDGYDDGSFKPEKVVTRAEMAVVIAKILHGADVDPSIFVGDNKFTDVPAWAEGYVNLCDSLGIIEGYGDGKFGPNDPVTTVQANIMLLKALGYYTAEGDTLPGNWADAQLAATSKATALGFFGEKALGMSQGLTREDVAELTFNALFAQRVAYDDVRGLHVKANDRNVVVTNGTNDELNTLANNTFGLYSVEGTVTANSYTNLELMEDDKTPALTTVTFAEKEDLDRDGKYTDTSYDFDFETGLEMIGHAAKVYYKLEKGAPKTFAILDRATMVGEIYAGTSGEIAKAANALGFKKDTVMSVIEANETRVNYDNDTKETMGNVVGSKNKLILVSNSANHTVDYVIMLEQTLDTVKKTVEDGEDLVYVMETYNAADLFVLLDDVAVDDYVILTNIGRQNELVMVEKAELRDAKITELVGSTALATADLKTIVADGTDYKESPVGNAANLKDTTAFQAVKTLGETTLILDEDEKLIGLAQAAKKDIGYAYVAQFGTKHVNDNSKFTTEKLAAHIYYADGTNEVRIVDDQHSAGSINAMVNDTTGVITLGDANKLAAADAHSNELPHADSSLGVYYVTENRDGSVRLLDIDGMDDVANTYDYDECSALDPLKFTKNHSLLMKEDGTVATVTNAITASNNRAYSTNDTVYFYVNGKYGDATNPMVVTPKVGVSEIVNFKESDATVTLGEIWVKTVAAGRNTVEALAVYGVEIGSSENIYYFNENDFTVSFVDTDNYAVNFKVHDKDGAEAIITYEGYETADKARTAAGAIASGYYKPGANALTPVWKNAGGLTQSGTINSMVYGVEALAYVQDTENNESEFVGNLYAKLDDDTDTNGVNDNFTVVNYGVIFDDAKVVDLTGHNLNSVSKIIAAVRKGDTIQISYSYTASSYVSGVVYVTSYNAAAVVGPTQTSGTVALNGTAVITVGGVDYYYTKAFNTVEKAIANATTYKLGDVNVSVDVDGTVNAPDKAVLKVAGNLSSVDGAATAANGGLASATAGTVASLTGITLTDGGYVIAAVRNGASPAVDGYIAIEIVK